MVLFEEVPSMLVAKKGKVPEGALGSELIAGFEAKLSRTQ